MARTLGLVLAGGRSTRWGSEKAVARVGGAPMVAHVAAVLAQDCEGVAVNAPEASGAADWARARGLTVLPDAPGLPDGPLAGVLAGLVWAAAQGADGLVTAPCDTPELPPDLAARLAAELDSAPAAFAVTADGSHPLCAAWSLALLPSLRAELERGHPSVRGWLQEVGAREAAFAHAAAFRNLNTPPQDAPSQVTSVAPRRI